jgi:hypothetical protein
VQVLLICNEDVIKLLLLTRGIIQDTLEIQVQKEKLHKKGKVTIADLSINKLLAAGFDNGFVFIWRLTIKGN